MTKPGTWSRVLNGIYNWADRHSLCPCRGINKILQLVGLQASTNKVVLAINTLGMKACGWVLLKLPLTADEYEMIILQDKMREASSTASRIEFVKKADKEYIERVRYWN